VYAVGGDDDVGVGSFAVGEFQSCCNRALFKSDTTMARANGVWGKTCCQHIQQVSPVHAVDAIPAARIGRDD
jgi:hypothetical protein